MKALPGPLQQRLVQEAARGGMAIDLEVYAQAERSPVEPVLLGTGSFQARLGFFGRDPGRNEVLLGEPFIGKGGQLIRGGLHEAAFGGPPPDLDASIRAGQRVFWANTVPYKPVGNKAWSTAVKRRFVPMVREVLVDCWQGHDLVTLGNVAFEWFGLADPALKPALEAFWSRDDRYEASLSLTLDGKAFTLHPLPHPSPLNATWYRRFPDLLRARLRELGWDGRTWTVDGA